MISMIQPLHAGNALRLFLQPPAGATQWKILRKGSASIETIDDASAVVVYEGNESVITDAYFLQNEVMAFYRAFYLVSGSWAASNVSSGTPVATFYDSTVDALSFIRDRLEAGLKVEVERGNLVNELGYIQVFTAPVPSERDVRMPAVTLHVESAASGEWAIGDDISGDDESEGWLENGSLKLIGWTLNPDERVELRKAIRRVIIANIPVFAGVGIDQVSLTQSDVDLVGGEMPAPVFQADCTLSYLAPVRVAGIESAPVADIDLRSL